ncbi:MAG: SDR family oxidoreductase [Actinobacteria bacterium]|nr:SDR family oxidoreductase [Actinomycetota bacterium]
MASTPNIFDLSGRTAVVTGGSSGLGVTFAQALAAAGANVVVSARRADRLAAVVADIEANGGNALAVTCDVTDPAACDAMIAAAVDRYGSVDVVVANAGAVPEGGAQPEKMPGALFAESVTMNLVGTFNTCASAGRHMLPRGAGSIVTIASVAGIGGHFNAPAGYSASKAGIANLTQHLALRWGDRGVRVNGISPGWFPSEMTDRVLGLPIWVERLNDQTAMRRLGRPEELVGALLLLASDAGSYMTGQIVGVDGGMTSSVGQSPYSEALWGIHAVSMPGGVGERIMPGS